MKKQCNWAELLPELTASIFDRLSVIEILENAQTVCKSWYRVSKDPLVWRKIDIEMYSEVYDLDRICRHVVDRSQGSLVEINIGNFCSDDLLDYIADRSSNLRSLGLDMHYRVTNEGLVNALAKLPLFEELKVSRFSRRLNWKAIGNSCPKLKTLKVFFARGELIYVFAQNHDAIEIAKSMPELRHLQVFGNGLTNIGVKAILGGCSHLEHLDLRQCLNVILVGDLEKRCFKRIKVLRRPDDSIDDCHFGDSDDDFSLAYVDNDNDIEVDFDQVYD